MIHFLSDFCSGGFIDLLFLPTNSDFYWDVKKICSTITTIRQTLFDFSLSRPIGDFSRVVEVKKKHTHNFYSRLPKLQTEKKEPRFVGPRVYTDGFIINNVVSDKWEREHTRDKSRKLVRLVISKPLVASGNSDSLNGASSTQSITTRFWLFLFLWLLMHNING